MSKTYLTQWLQTDTGQTEYKLTVKSNVTSLSVETESRDKSRLLNTYECL